MIAMAPVLRFPPIAMPPFFITSLSCSIGSRVPDYSQLDVEGWTLGWPLIGQGAKLRCRPTRWMVGVCFEKGSDGIWTAIDEGGGDGRGVRGVLGGR